MPRKNTSKPLSSSRGRGRPPKPKSSESPKARKSRKSSVSLRNEGGAGGISGEENITHDEELTEQDLELLHSMQESQDKILSTRTKHELSTPPTLQQFLENLEVFLYQIWLGVHPHVAALMEGVPRGTYDDWMTLGKRDYEQGIQSDEAYLYGSVIRKLAHRRSVAETTVALNMPLEYLRRGGARILGDEWVDIKDQVLADKSGIGGPKDGNNVNFNGTVHITVSTFEQVAQIYQEYNIGGVNAAMLNEADVNESDCTVADQAEEMIKDRGVINSSTNPPRVTTSETHNLLSALQMLRTPSTSVSNNPPTQ